MGWLSNWHKSLLLFPFRVWLRRKPIATPVIVPDNASILVMRYDALGDMIVTLPMIAEIHRLLPTCAIDVVASPSNSILLDGNPVIRTVYQHKKSIGGLWLLFWGKITGRFTTRYALVFSVVVHKTTHAGIVAGIIAGANTTVAAIAHAHREEEYGTWFNVQVPFKRNCMSMARMQVQLVQRVLGHSTDACSPLPSMQSLWESPLPDLLDSGSRVLVERVKPCNRIAYNVSAGALYRTLTPQQHRNVVEGVLRELPHSVIVVYSHPDDHVVASNIVDIAPDRIVRIMATPNVTTVFGSLRHVGLVISPDTSMVHAAAAMQIPVVVLYSHVTDYLHEWQPEGTPSIGVYTHGAVPLSTLQATDIVDATLTLWNQCYDACNDRGVA
jgi:ADP-heptose:LPS heptosyltransferase